MITIDYERIIEMIANKVIEKINANKLILSDDIKKPNAILINTKNINVEDELDKSFSDCNIYSYSNEDCITLENADILIVSHLDIGQMGRLAQGIAINECDEIILNALCDCKKVYVLNKKECKNKAMMKILENNYNLLIESGVVFDERQVVCNTHQVLDSNEIVLECENDCQVLFNNSCDTLNNELDFNDKKVIVEKDIENLKDNTVLIINKPVITPSAKDFIKSKNITLMCNGEIMLL